MSSIVSIVKNTGDLVAAVDQAMTLAGLGDCISRGDRVLIKPNMHGGGGHGSEEGMTAACRWAFSKGAREVVLGDGSFWGNKDVRGYFERTGLLAACEATGAVPADFHVLPFRLLHPESPHVPRVLGVSRLVYDCDVVINMPIIKTHLHTMITIALKNVKGFLRPVDKRRLHETELNRALGIVNALVQPQVTATLCDGLTGWEGMGPSNATPVDLGLFMASRDPVALDTVACQLMQLEPESVKLLRECAQRGVGTMAPAEIEVVGERLEDHRRRFKLPYEALADDYPGVTIFSEGACTGCTLSLCNALTETRKEGHPLPVGRLLIGPGPETEADLLIGRCAGQGRSETVDVPGCPPTATAICEAFAKLAKKRS
jgi:uncharacterized protein (DUF362 family)